MIPTAVRLSKKQWEQQAGASLTASYVLVGATLVKSRDGKTYEEVMAGIRNATIRLAQPTTKVAP